MTLYNFSYMYALKTRQWDSCTILYHLHHVRRLSCDHVGHALEAGWFLLQYAAGRGDQELKKVAVDKFLELSFNAGWDPEHGGLFYFLDADGDCPTQVGMVAICVV